jgi:hypothetical protein
MVRPGTPPRARPSTCAATRCVPKAGLPRTLRVFPLLARYPEVKTGAIRHALRVTVPQSQRGYIHPATHFASRSNDPTLPPMGLRLRLKADYSLDGFSGQEAGLQQLKSVPGSAFEAVESGPIIH